MYPKNPLLQKCLTYLESLPNIKATIQGEPYFSNEVLADGILTIHTSGQVAEYICEIKMGLTNDGVEPVAEYFLSLGERLKHQARPLLITRGLSNLVADQLLDKNIEFIDVDGNIYLNNPGTYILIRKQIPKENSNKSLEITAAALQVIYALLRSTNFSQIGYGLDEQISLVSGVTPRTVKTILGKLQALDYIKFRHNRYEIIDYTKLLERWELGYSERLRAKLFIGSFSPLSKQRFSEVEENIIQYAEEFNYLIGGELAAEIMTQNLRAIGATLHLKDDYDFRRIIVVLKLKPDPEGTITFLRTFGDTLDQCDVSGEFRESLVHPLLTHTELVHSGNSRLKEAARLIYDKYIEELGEEHG